MAYTAAQKAKFDAKLQKVFRECLDELDAIEIPYGNITEIKVNYRAMSRWGLCSRCGDIYKININVHLLLDDSTMKGLKETVIHEILHTCPECMCHTGEWKRLADLVNDCYNYNVKRCDDAKDKGFDEAEYDMLLIKEEADRLARSAAKRRSKKPAKSLPYKYEFYCVKCGQKIHRKRESEFTRNYENYRCGICGGKILPVGYVEVGFYGDMVGNKK